MSIIGQVVFFSEKWCKSLCRPLSKDLSVINCVI